jgi:hypothetical protein
LTCAYDERGANQEQDHCCKHGWDDEIGGIMSREATSGTVHEAYEVYDGRGRKLDTAGVGLHEIARGQNEKPIIVI